MSVVLDEQGNGRTSVGNVLNFAWNRGAFTASDVMDATALSRSTAIATCDDLVELGWLSELVDARQAGEAYRKGRPARRYEFNASVGYVIGVDAGAHSITALATDLRGKELARLHQSIDIGDPSTATRIRVIDQTIDEVIAVVDASPLCIAIAVPAPVDGTGLSPENDRFWRRMNPRLIHNLAERECPVLIDNDANLAAVAEGTLGSAVGASSYIAIMAGERMGAGYVVDGSLVRGRGQAGELHLLNLVDGVGSSSGIGAILRGWVREIHESASMPEESSLANIPAEELQADIVLAAARSGDTLALSLLERAADRVARICAVLGGLLDVERIIFAGAIASSLHPLLERAAQLLPTYTNAAPAQLVASELGADVVALGAAARAIEHVRRHALDFDVRPNPSV